MKRILIINGSPRREKSGTLRLAHAFVEGFAEVEEVKTEEVALSTLDIKPCLGCFRCWKQTPGECVIKDDMDMLRERIRWADVIVESFPLYFFGMPSPVKAMTDRMLPFTRAYEGNLCEGGSFHEMRDEAMEQKKLVVVSSCGYTKASHMYGALKAEYDMICGEGRYTSVFCGQGELLGLEALAPERERYFARVRAAGRELAKEGKVSDTTVQELDMPIVPYRAFEMLAKMHFSQP